MSFAGKTAVRSIVALLVLTSIGACNDDDDDAEVELIPRACACCNYANGICEKACDCGTSEQCALLYPSGNYQAWATNSVCVAKLALYCSESLVPSVLSKVCDIALTAAECVETDAGPALSIPTECLD
ncbi:MAG: hypothetical protein JRF63_03990 [Deltaproteobacteria bacterium]|nr:hypothetical protein [Deltaproteobacteria bacterium]